MISASLTAQFAAAAAPFVRLWPGARKAMSPPPAPTAARPAPIGVEAQWAIVTRHVEGATSRARRIAEAQRAARDKIDSAEYALMRLIEDLGDAMPTGFMAAEGMSSRTIAFRPPPRTLGAEQRIAA